jgi:signal transduction histidine kinase
MLMNAIDLAPGPNVPAKVVAQVALGSQPEGEREMLRRLASCLAHHVNNSLTGVIGYLELGLRGLSPRSAAADHLQASLDCAYQAASAVKRIVSFAARPETVQTDQLLALAGVTEQVIERLRAQKRPDLMAHSQVEAPGLVVTDETVLLAALDNIINNALEAMPTGGTLVLHVGECDGWCQLSVSDTGCGIPDEMLPHLFKPFHTSKTSGHLGLGLVQSRDLVHLLGGRLEVASVPGQGATVTMTLPSPSSPGVRHRDGVD